MPTCGRLGCALCCLLRSHSELRARPFWLRTARAFDSGISPCIRSRLSRCPRRGQTAGVPTNARMIGMEPVDHDERLRITGIEPGRYDVKLVDKMGRVCIVRDVEVEDGAVFSIEEKHLTDCAGDASRRIRRVRPGKRPAARLRCASTVSQCN